MELIKGNVRKLVSKRTKRSYTFKSFMGYWCVKIDGNSRTIILPGTSNLKLQYEIYLTLYSMFAPAHTL